MSYTPFLGKFPKIQYDAERKLYGNKETVTNIMLRVGIVKDTINQFGSYYYYSIQDGDTPENLAQQIYDDAGAHWLIQYANDIYDPQFDWPLHYESFLKYLVEKYRERIDNASVSRIAITNAGLGYSNGFIHFEGGSGTGSGANAFITVDSLGQIIATTMSSNGTNYIITDNPLRANVEHLINPDLVYQQANLSVMMNLPSEEDILAYTRRTPHHYEKVITRVNSLTGQSTETRFVVNGDQLTNGTMIVANNAASIGNVSIANSGSYYFNGYVNFEGGHGEGANAKVTVDSRGRIKTVEVINHGRNYQPNDVVVANVQHLARNVESDQYYAASLSVPIVTNGTGMLPIVGEYMSVNTDNTVVFSGNVVTYNASNNYLVLENTSGNFETAVFLVGDQSGCNLEILTTEFGLFDYYNNLPAGQYQVSTEIDLYTVDEVITRSMVSIYDYETEANDHKREIKIIAPSYYPQILDEYKKLLEAYNSNSPDVSTNINTGIRRLT